MFFVHVRGSRQHEASVEVIAITGEVQHRFLAVNPRDILDRAAGPTSSPTPDDEALLLSLQFASAPPRESYNPCLATCHAEAMTAGHCTDKAVKQVVPSFLAVRGQPKNSVRRMLAYDWLPHLVQKYLVDDTDQKKNRLILSRKTSILYVHLRKPGAGPT